MEMLSTGRAALALLGSLLGDALSPPACAACDAPVRRAVVFCAACAATVERAETPEADATIAALAYGGAVTEAIARLKYGGRPDLGRPLGDLIAGAIATAGVDA